jgi:polyhydroxyalkanoate synthesis regulator phasin
MAIKLKDLIAGQQRLDQKEEAPVRLNPDQFKGLVEALSGAATSAGAKSGAQIFEDFVNQTRKREELLKDATEEQKTIFHELEETLKKLQTANHTDSIGLRRSIDALNRRLAGTPNTSAKARMASMIPPAPASASTKNTFVPTLSPENYAVNESATTAGTAETKTAGTGGGGIGAAIQGIGTAIGGIAEGIGRAIEGLGRVLGAAIGALAAAMGIKNLPGFPDAPGGPGGPDVIGEKNDPKKQGPGSKKGPSAKPTLKQRIGQNLKLGGKLGIAGIATNILGNVAADQLAEHGHENIGAGVGIAADVAGYAGTGAMLGSILGPGGAVVGGALGAGYGLIEGVKNRTNLFDTNPNGTSFSSGSAPAEVKPRPMLSRQVQDLQNENQNLQAQFGSNPTIINNISAAPPAVTTSPPIFAPGPSIRPNESAFERHMFRGMMPL